MIASLTGEITGRSGDLVVVLTDGGVGYEVAVPAGVLARLPADGKRTRLYTELVVREDAWLLYGFDNPSERVVFQRLLGASGFGPKLALALLSALGPDRTVRAIRDRDLALLSSVSGIGRKKAERLVLELQDRFDDVPLTAATPRGSGDEEAVRALVALGYTPAIADDAVRAARTDVALEDTPALIRRALQRIATARAGR